VVGGKGAFTGAGLERLPRLLLITLMLALIYTLVSAHQAQLAGGLIQHRPDEWRVENAGSDLSSRRCCCGDHSRFSSATKPSWYEGWVLGRGLISARYYLQGRSEIG